MLRKDAAAVLMALATERACKTAPDAFDDRRLMAVVADDVERPRSRPVGGGIGHGLEVTRNLIEFTRLTVENIRIDREYAHIYHLQGIVVEHYLLFTVRPASVNRVSTAASPSSTRLGTRPCAPPRPAGSEAEAAEEAIDDRVVRVLPSPPTTARRDGRRRGSRIRDRRGARTAGRRTKGRP